MSLKDPLFLCFYFWLACLNEWLFGTMTEFGEYIDVNRKAQQCFLDLGGKRLKGML